MNVVQAGVGMYRTSIVTAEEQRRIDRLGQLLGTPGEAPLLRRLEHIQDITRRDIDGVNARVLRQPVQRLRPKNLHDPNLCRQAHPLRSPGCMTVRILREREVKVYK